MSIGAVQVFKGSAPLVQEGLVDDCVAMLTNVGDLKDVMETLSNGLEWFSLFTTHPGAKSFAEHANKDLGVRDAFHLPLLLGNLGRLRNEVRAWWYGDAPNSALKIWNMSTLCTYNASGVALFLDGIRVINLKDLVGGVKMTFWTALGLVDFVNLFSEAGNLEGLRKSHEDAKSDEVKELIQHKINLSCLEIAKSTTTVAMAAIALTALVFVSMAHYVLFSPVAILGLTTVWLVLNFMTFFYSRMIERAEEKLPVGSI